MPDRPTPGVTSRHLQLTQTRKYIPGCLVVVSNFCGQTFTLVVTMTLRVQMTSE